MFLEIMDIKEVMEKVDIVEATFIWAKRVVCISYEKNLRSSVV